MVFFKKGQLWGEYIPMDNGSYMKFNRRKRKWYLYDKKHTFIIADKNAVVLYRKNKEL